MDYEKLKDEIKQIAAIAADVPEPFRDKCFEVLLANLIGTTAADPRREPGNQKHKEQVHVESENSNAGTLPKPSQIRVFMTKTGVTEDLLKKVVMFEDGQIHFIREPAPSKVAQGQIEWALMLALKSGFEKNEFVVDPEDVRSICQEKGFYDAPNFASNFKTPKNAELFRGILKNQGDPQPLTNEGQAALARVVQTLAGA